MRPVRVTYTQKISMTCPKCGAPKNKMCGPVWAGYGYYTLATFHKDRRLAWLDWALKDAAKQ